MAHDVVSGVDSTLPRGMSKGASVGGARGLALGFGLFLLVGAGASAQDSKAKWEFEERQKGVALFTTQVQAHDYDVVKVVTTIDAPAAGIVEHLRRFADYPRWYHSCVEARVLRRPDQTAPILVDARGRFLPQAAQESYLLLYVQDAGPLDDRWAVVRNTIRFAGQRVIVAFNSVAAPKGSRPSQGVRMTMQGRWELLPLSSQRTKVTLVINVDPHTSTPAFVVDAKLREAALRTLQNLRRLSVRP